MKEKKRQRKITKGTNEMKENNKQFGFTKITETDRRTKMRTLVFSSVIHSFNTIQIKSN